MLTTKRPLFCLLKQTNPLHDNEFTCGCGWPMNACRDMHPDLWRHEMWPLVGRAKQRLTVTTITTVEDVE